MQCEDCHKTEATVHIQEFIGDKRISLHLCHDCAADKGIKADTTLSELDLAALVLQLAKAKLAQQAKEEAVAAKPAAPGAPIVCPRCGCTDQDYEKLGLLGCPACYDAFRSLLHQLLPAMHRGVRHLGKMPGKPAQTQPPAPPVRPGLDQLEAALAKAVAGEDYERAAELRDSIRSLREARRNRKPLPHPHAEPPP